MNIWLIQTGEPLPLNDSVRKMRMALLCDELVKRGHSVLWWASAFDHLSKSWIAGTDAVIDMNGSSRIYALRGTGYRRNVSLSRFIDHRIIAAKFSQYAPRLPKPDIIVASMPQHDLAYEAVVFAKKNNIPVLVDIRDEWPDLFLRFAPEPLRWLLRAFLVHDFRMVERLMVRADALVAMMDSLLKWGLTYAGRPQGSLDRVFYLGSRPNSGNNNGTPGGTLGFLEGIRGKFVITFIGTFVKNNNPSVIVEGAERLSNENIHFILAGDGELQASIKDRCRNFRNVTVPGWLNKDDMALLLRHSHVGVCPTDQAREAFPNKTFSYFSAGLPVLSAFQGELREIIEKRRIGSYFPPADADAFVDCVLRLYNAPDLYQQMAANSKRAFHDLFDADMIYEKYAAHIEKIAAEYRAGSA